MELTNMAIAPQFNRLLDDCREMAISHLRPLLDRMFENADVALLGFAEKAESNMAQSVFFEAMTEVRKKRSSIEQHFLHEITRSFSEFPLKPDASSEPGESDKPGGGLSLVDPEAMETSVAMLNASTKLGTRIMDKIFGLKQRLSIINGGALIEEQQIPAGPAWLGAAYRHAIQQLELESKVRLVFIALYEKYVFAKVDTLFDEFNERLIQAGILPHLRYEIRKQAGGMEIVEATADSEPPQPAAKAATEAASSEQTPSKLGDELFGRICELISVRRGATHPGRGTRYAGGPDGGHATGYAAEYGANGASAPVSPHASGGPGVTATAQAGAPMSAPGSTLVTEISRLQSLAQSAATRLSTSEFIENIEIDENLIEGLQSTLNAEREKIFRGVDRRKLPAADTNVIELVGMLFEYMLMEEKLPNVVKALLSRLHTPLLKVAVVDRQFFTRAAHPARKLLNDMTAAGKRWVEESNIERGIFPKMKEIVDRVLVEFEEDVGIFELFLQDFNKSVSELQQRARLVEQRNAEAADGQDKLHAARARAQQEIVRLAAEKPLGEAGHDFLRRVWADKLTFILLRNAEGDTCKDWHTAVSLAQRMIDSLLPPASEEARQKRQQALAELQQELRQLTRMMQQGDKDKLVARLFESQQTALEKIVPLGARNVPATPPTPAQHTVPVDAHGGSDKQPLTAAQRTAIAQLQGIPFGTWFEFSSEGEAPQRVKLSWRSTITEKFMFVDQMGVKAVVVSMRELADCVINGRARVLREEKKPFVDRALQAIHRMLDHGAKQKASA